MSSIKVAHLRVQGVDFVFVPLAPGMARVPPQDQTQLVLELRNLCRSAGLAGDVVPVWQGASGTSFMASPAHQPMLAKSLRVDFVRNNLTQLLPRKFKVAFTSTDRDVAVTGIHDLGLFPRIENGQKGFRIYTGGGTAILPRVSYLLYDFVPLTDYLKVAEAVLRIDSHQIIKDDAAAVIITNGLIGTAYVSIDLGSEKAAALKPGSEIRTQKTPDLNEVMAQIGDLGKKLDGALQGISGAFAGDGRSPGVVQRIDQLVTDNRENLSRATANLQLITDRVNRGEGTLGKLVKDEKLYTDRKSTRLNSSHRT